MKRREAVTLLSKYPYKIAQSLGFKDMTTLHNDWMREMLLGQNDDTLQAHRGSYKTTCLSVVLAIIIILYPNKKTAFFRKTDDDVKEIVSQVKKILNSGTMRYLVRIIWNVNLELTVDNALQLSTNLCTDNRGTCQLSAFGIMGSLTGKHYDLIFTDDIVNIKDRLSRAEREHTKQIYDELKNLVNRNEGCRIFNIGTPWHKDDAFVKMPAARKYDCYTTGLITSEKLEEIKKDMDASLFAANYELRHVAAADVLFDVPKHADSDMYLFDGAAHIDASYGGSDSTAFTIMRYKDGKYYVLGKLYHDHVDNCLNKIYTLYDYYHVDKIRCELNGDKGYLSKEIRSSERRVYGYHEKTNKYIKIASYLKMLWKDIYFVEGTDEEYISQICDYNENAEHDDAPDSLACLCREFVKRDVAKKDEFEKLYGKHIESEEFIA